MTMSHLFCSIEQKRTRKMTIWSNEKIPDYLLHIFRLCDVYSLILVSNLREEEEEEKIVDGLTITTPLVRYLTNVWCLLMKDVFSLLLNPRRCPSYCFSNKIEVKHRFRLVLYRPFRLCSTILTNFNERKRIESNSRRESFYFRWTWS